MNWLYLLSSVLSSVALGANAPALGGAADERPQINLSAAVRCEECHEKMVKEWKHSAHARSASNPLYVAMRAHASNQAKCDSCHAPLLAVVDAGHPGANEGVTCDVCHSLKEVTPNLHGAKLNFELTDNVKYGPLCDAKKHYFHKMGCSPLHKKPAFCGGCHLWYMPGTGQVELPIHTEYEDWQANEGVLDGSDCQSCHMPGDYAEVAKGAKKRVGVPDHGLLGVDNDLRKQALSLVAVASDDHGTIRLAATLKNDGAGHSVPGGLPEHQVVFSVSTLDDHGHTIDSSERIYGRKLVDSHEVEVPFYQAARVLSDTRIAPTATRDEKFALKATSAGKLLLEVKWRAISPELQSLLKVPVAEEVVMLRAVVPFGAMRARGGRDFLPKTIKVK